MLTSDRRYAIVVVTTEYGLFIQRGGGIGPVKPRQRVRHLSNAVPIPSDGYFVWEMTCDSWNSPMTGSFLLSQATTKFLGGNASMSNVLGLRCKQCGTQYRESPQ